MCHHTTEAERAWSGTKSVLWRGQESVGAGESRVAEVWFLLDGQLEGDVHLSFFSQRYDFRQLYDLKQTEQTQCPQQNINPGWSLNNAAALITGGKCVVTIFAASSRSSQARIFNGLAAIRALASSTLVPEGRKDVLTSWKRCNIHTQLC